MAGAADVILIPGLASSREVWRATADRLKATHRVHLVQLAGFAGEPWTHGDGAFVQPAVDELARYAATLNRPAVIGHSMGGMTGVMLALVPFDWQVHDTHFVVAHMHYVLVGGMLFPLMAGLYYWLPHFSGRMPSVRLGKWGFWLVFIGFNITFLIMHWTGLMGMPRRIYTYQSGLGWDIPNLISSVGSFIMAIGIATLLLDIILHFRFGQPAKANPWNADTLEWATSLPPSAYNFVSLPEIHSRHPLWDNPELPHSIARGEHALGVIDHGRRETWGTEVRLLAGFDHARAELTVRQSAAQWAAEGLQTMDGRPLPPLASAAVLAPAGARGPAFLVGQNFRTILRYNNSTSYALAVALLAQRLDGGPGVVADWPRDLQPLSREQTRQLQTALNARGFDTGTPDGVQGPATRAGLRFSAWAWAKISVRRVPIFDRCAVISGRSAPLCLRAT